MRNKILKGIGIFLFTVVFLSTFCNVQATFLNDSGIELTLPEGWIPIYEDSSWLEQNQISKEEAIEKLNQKGVLIDQMNQDRSKELSIIQINTKTTQKLFNMSQLKEEEIQEILNQYVKLQQESGNQVNKQEVIQRELTYLHLQTQNQTTNSDIYYTIVNGVALTFSLNYYQGTIEDSELNSIIESINLVRVDKQPVSQETISWTSSIFAGALLAIAICYTIYRRKKWKKELEVESDHVKIKKLNEKYCKWGVIQTFFIATSVISICLFLGNTYQVIRSYTMQESASAWGKIYFITQMLQSVILILLLGMNIRLAFRKREDTRGKIIKNFLWVALIGMMIPVFRILFVQELYGANRINPGYYSQELENMMGYLFYAISWGMYFYLSIRVKVYYDGKTIENILTTPRKSMIEKWRENQEKQKAIVTFFQGQQATNKQKTIALEEIPKEYSNSKMFWQLRELMVLRKKKQGYYLNEKAMRRKISSTLLVTIKKCIPIMAIIFLVTVLLLFI